MGEQKLDLPASSFMVGKEAAKGTGILGYVGTQKRVKERKREGEEIGNQSLTNGRCPFALADREESERRKSVASLSAAC